MSRHYFISDLHLGASYIKDARAHEARVVAFLDSIKQHAASLYLLGDVLDYWFEYRNVVPRGHVRFFGKLAELADAGVKLFWFTGNHDVWLRDYLRDEIGITIFNGHTTIKIDDHPIFFSHGDDVGHQSPIYRVIRWCFHNPVCQWLYAGIHPRWTTSFATGWSSSNRTSRKVEKEIITAQAAAIDLKKFADKYSTAHPEVKHFVFGHLHIAEQATTPSGASVTLLGDWIKQDTYAVLEDGEIRLYHWE